MSNAPIWFRKFIVDFVETGFAVLLTLNVAFPTTADEAGKVVAAVLVGVIGAAVSALRRAVPDFLIWLREKMKLPPANGN